MNTTFGAPSTSSSTEPAPRTETRRGNRTRPLPARAVRFAQRDAVDPTRLQQILGGAR